MSKVLSSFLLLMVFSTGNGTLAQASKWDKYIQDGVEAADHRDFPKSAKNFKSALDEASTEEKSERIEKSLDCLVDEISKNQHRLLRHIRSRQSRGRTAELDYGVSSKQLRFISFEKKLIPQSSRIYPSTSGATGAVTQARGCP